MPESDDACTQSSDNLASDNLAPHTETAVSEPRRQVIIENKHKSNTQEQLTIDERLKRYDGYPP